MIAAMLLLVSEPLVTTCSSRRPTCERVRTQLLADAQRCQVSIEFRPHNPMGNEIIITADATQIDVIITEETTQERKACLSEAVRTVHSRLYSSQVSVHDQRQQVLNRIADECGLTRATFELIGDDRLHVKPEPNARYQSVDCALQKLKESKLPVKMGFVGNEQYAPELK